MAAPVRFLTDEELFGSNAAMAGGNSPSVPAPAMGGRPNQPGFQASEALRNIPRSAGKLISDAAGAIAHPVQTVKGISRVLGGAASKLIPGRQGVEDDFDAVVGMYKDRYGGWDKFLDTLEQDPVGVISDASIALGGGGAALKGVGAVTKSSKIAAAGAKAAGVAGAIDPFVAGAKVAGKVPGVSAALETIKFLPERLVRSATGQSKAELIAGKDVSKFVIKEKRIGTAQQLIRTGEQEIDLLSRRINDTLKANNSIFTRNDIARDFVTRSNLVRNAEMNGGTALVQILKSYPQTKRLLSKKSLSILEVNELRQILDRGIGDAAFLATQEGAFAKELAKDFSNHLRSEVQRRAPDTVPLFDNLESEINLKDAVEAKFAGQSRNQVVTFGDLIGGGLGTAFGGPAGGLAGLAGRRVLQSTPVLTGGAVALDAVGKVLSKLEPVERANVIRFMRSLANAQPGGDEDPLQGGMDPGADGGIKLVSLGDEEMAAGGGEIKLVSLGEDGGAGDYSDIPADPDIIAQSIMENESGGDYEARGGSGERGAYQFMPEVWKEWAGRFLKNGNAPMTPENQDFVARARIQELLDQGVAPYDIPLVWNGGSAKVKKGVNRYGVQYNTGAYRDKVVATIRQKLQSQA